MPESSHPFAVSEVVVSDHDITHHHDMTHPGDSANDDMPELTSEDVADLELRIADDDDVAPLPFEPPEPPPAVAPVALARVSFSAPATLSFDGYQETFDVTLMNLSTQGVACLGPHGLNVADTVRLTFALAAGRDPVSLLCEVMWSQPSTPREDAYGLRFNGVESELLAQVEEVVRLRCDGAAAGSEDQAVMHAILSRSAQKPGWGPWGLAAAGAATGMLATLAVMVLVESSIFKPAVQLTGASLPASAHFEARANPKVAPRIAPKSAAPGAAPKATLAQAATRKSDAASALSAEAVGPPAPTAPGRTLAPVPISAISTAPAAPSAPAPARVAPAVASGSAATGSQAASSATSTIRHVGDLRVEEFPDAVALTLRTRGPAALHEEFWLGQPARLVVDVPAARSALEGRTFEVKNDLVARVRVGDHADKVRFVIETNKNVSSRVSAKAVGDALRIELRRR